MTERDIRDYEGCTLDHVCKILDELGDKLARLIEILESVSDQEKVES